MGHEKAIVAVVMAVLLIIDQWFGTHWGNEQVVETILAVLTPILVWLVPNRPKLGMSQSSGS